METECDKLLISQKDYGTDSDVASVRAASNGPLSASGSESEERYSTYPMSDLISSQEHFTKDEITRQVKKAKVLSVLTLLATSTITVLSFISSKDSDSSAAYGFAFDSFLAGVTSSIVLWRFWSVKQLEHHDRKREFTALFIITISLLITGALIAYEAIDALAHTEKHKKSTMLLVLSSVSSVFYLVLFILKYRLAKRLGSRALRTDSMDALCGSILALSIAITSTTRQFTDGTWFLDSTIAIGVAVFSLVYGVYSLMQLVRMRKDYREFVNGKVSSEIVYKPGEV